MLFLLALYLNKLVGFEELCVARQVQYTRLARALRVPLRSDGPCSSGSQGSVSTRPHAPADVSFCINHHGRSFPNIYCKGTLKKTTAHARSHKFTYAQASLALEVRTLLNPDDARPSETFTTRMVYGLLFPAVVAYSGPLRTFQAVAVNSAASTAYAMVTLPAYSARRPARDESGVRGHAVSCRRLPKRCAKSPVTLCAPSLLLRRTSGHTKDAKDPQTIAQPDTAAPPPGRTTPHFDLI